jgi:hypothetical protein
VDQASEAVATDMQQFGWNCCSGLINRDAAIIEVADQLGDQFVRVTKHCTGLTVWIKDC